MRDAEEYRLIFRSPSLCVGFRCNIFVGIDTNIGNSSFLDIYMEGEGLGWVAVGFSHTQDMVLLITIIGCKLY